jgi:hypothetical protein
MLAPIVTPVSPKGFTVFIAALVGALAVTPAAAEAPEIEAESERDEAGVALDVGDRGIFSDLDDRVRLPAPRRATSALLDPSRGLLTVYDGDRPVKAYPTRGPASVRLGSRTIALRAADAAEIRALGSLDLRVLARGAAPPPGDADGDGIADPLDLLMGAKKTALNRARYGAGYIRIGYPMGDVPRDVGVCTDVVIRAARNLGIDLQRELSRDIARARRAYPMVKRPNRHIDHRRVKTLLPYFRRHWRARGAAIDDPADPLEPGDVVFMDTFPNRAGPDHIGIVSDRRGASGHLVIINNWTDGSVTREMDLLGWVPVTHRFRVDPR